MVTEVGARFSLDAMPGKQLSIDADMRNGAITQTEAKILRGEPMDDADLEAAVQLGALNLMQAGRPSVRAAAMKIMQEVMLSALSVTCSPT